MPLTDLMSTQGMPRYSTNYKDAVFLIWWKNGKPPIGKLWNIIPDDENSNHPSKGILEKWVRDEFTEKATTLDAEFYSEIESQALQEKAEMLRRHTNVGTQMQDMSLKYLKEHEEELTINSATRLLIEGVRIERESRGIPDAFDNLSEKTDDELLKELQKLLSSSSMIDIQPIENVE
jgi:hypothetical protein